MHCSRCGTELPVGARFCATCGAPVDGALLPPWARALGVLSALVVAVVLVVTVVLPENVEDVAGSVVAGRWDCELEYEATDDNDEFSTDWDVEFFEDGRLTVGDQDESAEGEWSYEDGELSVDFGDADLGNPELTTQTIDVHSLDELTIAFERTDADDEDDIGDRTLTCERED